MDTKNTVKELEQLVEVVSDKMLEVLTQFEEEEGVERDGAGAMMAISQLMDIFQERVMIRSMDKVVPNWKDIMEQLEASVEMSKLDKSKLN